MERKRAYITALSPRSVNIGGPPSTLNSLSSFLDQNAKSSSRSRPHRVPIFAPYHAPHLYTRDSVAEVLRNLPSLDETFCSSEWSGQPRTLIGALSGEFYSASSKRDLLEKVLYNVLAQPMYWEKLLGGCSTHVANVEASTWVVRPFGPSPAAQSIASTLKAEGIPDVKFDVSFGSSTSLVPTSKRTPLAVVGMAGRFPHAANHNELWKVLEKGLDCHKIVSSPITNVDSSNSDITQIPTDRFDANTHLSKARYGCFIDEPGAFDARFFNLSPREALQTDPGQRLALATAYEALEMAGYVPNRTPSAQLDRVGTFYGQTSDEYKEQNMTQDVGTYFIPGSIRAFGPVGFPVHALVLVFCDLFYCSCSGCRVV